jgi:hypothetical protein
VPNLDMVFGYTNASWTLKADLVNRYMCRVLNHMAAEGYDIALPVAPPEGPAAPFIDLTSGYVQRGLAGLPKQGARSPWRLHQNYFRDIRLLRFTRVQDEGIRFSRRGGVRAGARRPAGAAAA